MITIAIFTTTRAEFGLFKPLLNRIIQSDDFDYKLFVGGTHLKKTHGFTIEEIKKEGYKICGTFNYLLNGDSPFLLTRSVAKATEQLAHIFRNEDFNFVCILGDRYELLSIVQAAIIFRKPLIHIHGGEITKGAFDEQIRHMITKASHIHFVSCGEYYDNVRKMGEQEWRIFNSGALAAENIRNFTPLNKQTLFQELGLNTKKGVVLLTYHPVTLEIKISPKDQISNLLIALDNIEQQIIVTMPNIDPDSEGILNEILKKVDNRKVFFIKSLGTHKYLSLINYADFVIGNSSSGILEVPYFKIPTINVGSRQDGRLRHRSVIDCYYGIDEILKAIEKALNKDFRESLHNMKYKFGDGNASEKILEGLRNVLKRVDLIIKKLEFPC